MTTLVLTVVVFMLAGLGLGLGVLMNRRPIAGSCGGLACRRTLGLDCAGGCDKGDDDHD